MRTTRLSTCLLAAAALAGCGSEGLPGGQPAPSAGALVADSLDALARQRDASARFELRAEGKPELSGPAALMVGDRLSVEVEGVASATAFTASGKVEAAGKSFEGEVRAGDGFYLRVGDDWYGAPDGGPGSFTVEAPAGVEPGELARALRDAGDGLVDGDVEPGPEIGGDDTWQVKGTVNPDAVVAIGRRIGAPLSAEDEALLRGQADRVQLEYAIGRVDHLPRRIALSGALASADMPAGVRGRLPLEALELEIELKLSDWGTPVQAEAPGRYTSFEELLGSFFMGPGFGVAPAPRAEPPPGSPQTPIPAPDIPQPDVPPPPAVPPPPPAAPAPPPAGTPPPPPGAPPPSA